MCSRLRDAEKVAQGIQRSLQTEINSVRQRVEDLKHQASSDALHSSDDLRRWCDCELITSRRRVDASELHCLEDARETLHRGLHEMRCREDREAGLSEAAIMAHLVTFKDDMTAAHESKWSS